ncbi:UNVERIFIED_CONTAM: hypothetical protein DES50_101597 [Williamsia faeni]
MWVLSKSASLPYFSRVAGDAGSAAAKANTPSVS